MTSPRLQGLRLLVAEDEAMIAMLIEDVLRDEGCEILGSYSSFAGLAEAASSQHFHGALLDVNLNGQQSFPVAEALSTRHVPFILLTGYDEAAIAVDRPEWVICGKPFGPETLISMIERHILPQSQMRC